MVELLKQGQYHPYTTIDQCISIFAGTRGALDDLPRDSIHAFEEALLDHFRGAGSALRERLAEAKSFKGLEDEFLKAINDFKSGWHAG